MISSSDLQQAKYDYTKNLVSDQTFRDITVIFNSAGVAFDVTHGLGHASDTSSAVFLSAGGFPDQRVVATMKFPSPTTAGTEDLGVILRVSTLIAAASTYLYAKVKDGTVKLVEVVDGTATTLTSSAWSVAQNVNITIDTQVVGTAFAATFTAASGPSPITINATTNLSNVPARGVMGFRSISKAIWCSSFRGIQL